ncbi:hypothetical protein ACP275_12G005600 [Erythranthe tilingii]
MPLFSDGPPPVRRKSVQGERPHQQLFPTRLPPIARLHVCSSSKQMLRHPNLPELPHIRRSFFRRRGSLVVKLVECRDVIVVQLHGDRLHRVGDSWMRLVTCSTKCL